MNIPIEEQKKFIAQYEALRLDYERFADFLIEVLKKATGSMSIMAIVEARAKGVFSFANKIISKDKYQNPLADMTDLCGGRVVVHFQSHIDLVCKFISDNFEIDEANSLDQKSRLKVNEFGYRSIHYIVTPVKDSIMGIPVAKEFKTMKAEIQVRTLAEHIWAAISHDRIYKTDLIIPDNWKREAAQLSAILENADSMFAKMSNDIDSVCNSYELQYTKDKAGKDIQVIQTMLEIMDDKPEKALEYVLKLNAIYRAMNKHVEADQLLAFWMPKYQVNSPQNYRLCYELAMIYLEDHFREIHSSKYSKYIKDALKHLNDLNNTIQENPKDLDRELSHLYFRLGLLLQSNHEKSSEALVLIGQAHKLMPENPLYFTALIESTVLRNLDTAQITILMFQNGINQAIEKLHELISLGIDKLSAWFAIGQCQFFLGNTHACLKAYANAVEVIRDEKYIVNRCLVDAETDRLGRFKRLNEKLGQQVQLYLNLAMAVSEKTPEKNTYKLLLEDAQICKQPLIRPIVIVAGGASKMEAHKVETYRPYIEELMCAFKGTIISGGTTAGIPGLVGDVKACLKLNGLGAFDLLAYLPKYLPSDAIKHKAYDYFYEIDSNNFSALDILSGWIDIVLSGVNPNEVILIGIDGGEIATLEYRIALSLGAKVCLIAYSGRAVFDFTRENVWKDHPNLILLPNDEHTVWAIVNQTTETTLTHNEIEEIAPKVHEFYRQQRVKSLKPDETDINKYKVVMQWDKLDSALKLSNQQQVAFYELTLKRVNLGIRKSDSPLDFNIKENLSKENYDLLARLEHARWNAERLMEGWKYGPDKDLLKKISPFLLPWDELEDEIRKYDYYPVNNIPKLLATVGYEVYKVK